MTQPIESSGFADIINNLFTWLTKDYKVSDKKTLENNSGESFTLTTANNHKIHAKLLKVPERRDKYNLYLVSDNNQQDSFASITKDQVTDKIAEFIDAKYPEADTEDSRGQLENNFDVAKTFDNTNSSKKLQIQASYNPKTQSYDLHKVYSNYNASESLDDITEVFCELSLQPEDDEEAIIIDESPICLEIVPQEDEYTVEPIEEVSFIEPIALILKAQYELLALLDDSNHNFNYPDDYFEYRDYFKSIITMQKEFILNTRLSAGKDFVDVIDILSAIDFQSLRNDYSDLSSRIEDYACILDLYYPNFDHEVQMLLDEWLLSLRYHHN